MDIAKLLKQYEEIEFDSMEDETGRKEIVEHVLDDGEDLGLYIQTTGSLYRKYLQTQIKNNTKIAWDRLVADGVKLYKKEIEDKDFTKEEIQTAKEYIQDYYAGELSPQQLEDTGRNYETLTVKPAKFTKEKYEALKIKRNNKKSLKEDFKEIKSQVDEAIDKWIQKSNWGNDYIEIFADYRDELDENSINKILEHSNRAYEIIDNLYFDNDYFGDDEYAYAFKQLDLDKDLKEKYEDEIKEYFRDRIGIRADYNHFLTDVRVDILIGEQVPDTYTFEDGKLVDVSDAVKFFIEKQGHTVQEFLDHYNSLPDFERGTGKTGYDSKTFFGSLVSEVDNAYRDYWFQPIIMGYINLAEYVKNPNAKQLEIPAIAYCGLTDRTNGTCSNLSITLEKPFIIDKEKDNFELYYYHGYKYNVDDICGLVSECWDKAEIKLIGSNNESFKRTKRHSKLNEKVAEKISFKLGTTDVEVTNSTGDDITAEDIKTAIEKENPTIFFNDVDAYHYIMDFSFEKNGKKYWVESTNIEGDFSKFELNVYKGFSESVVNSLLKNIESLENLSIRKMVESVEYTLNSKVKDFYVKRYPTDELGQEIPENLTFDDIYNNIANVYDLLAPADDSVVRERVFEKLAEIVNVDYDDIYNKWLACDESIENSIGRIIKKVGTELKEDTEDEDSPRHIYGQKKENSIPVALKTTYYPTWNKEEIVKIFDNEEEARDYAEERGNAVKLDYLNNTNTSKDYGLVCWVTPFELDYIKEHGCYPSEEESIVEDLTLKPSIAFDDREGKYACFTTKEGGAIKYTDTKEEAEQFLIDNYGVKKEEIELVESRADKIKKGIHKRRVVRENKVDDEKTAEKLIKELFGKIGEEKDNYKLDYNYGQASVVQIVNEQGGIQRILIAKNLNDLVDKLAEIKSYIKHKNIKLEEALKFISRKNRLTENDSNWERDAYAVCTDRCIRLVAPIKYPHTWEDGTTEKIYHELVALIFKNNNENSKAFGYELSLENLGSSSIIISEDFDSLEETINECIKEIKIFDEKNDTGIIYNVSPLEPTADDIKYLKGKLDESLNEVKKETAAEPSVQKQIKSLIADITAETEEEKEEADKLADEATKSNKRFKNWKKSKKIESTNILKKKKVTKKLNEEVVAKFDDGKHEIIKCDKGYYNRYNIKNGKAKFTTKCVESLPTALGALKKRFPNAQEVTTK